jgi:hypothetical protein
LNGKPINLSEENPGVSVNLENYPDLLKAYKFDLNGETVYNTYNLLRGKDNWDPMNVRQKVAAASGSRDVGNIPMRMLVSDVTDGQDQTPPEPWYLWGTTKPRVIETGKDEYRILSYTILGDTKAKASGSVSWRTLPGQSELVSLKTLPDGKVEVRSNNRGNDDIEVIIEAVSSLGIHGSIGVTTRPAQQPAPVFSSRPVIQSPANGKLKVNYAYTLDTYTDQSIVNWYRCDTESGTNAIPVSVSRLNKPELEYTLSWGDIGKYIKVEVTPKHNLSNTGTMVSAMYTTAISQSDVSSFDITIPDFQNFPAVPQPQVLPGYWTVDGNRPVDHSPDRTWRANPDSWVWAMTTAGTDLEPGFRPKTQGARLRYTPPVGTYGDMAVTVKVNTCKEDEGFGSATGQMLDIFIKYDTATQTGYALRLERTNRQIDGTEWAFVKYDNGNISPLYPAIRPDDRRNPWDEGYWDTRLRSSVFMTQCTIQVWTEGNKLKAKATTTAAQTKRQKSENLVHEVNLET